MPKKLNRFHHDAHPITTSDSRATAAQAQTGGIVWGARTIEPRRSTSPVQVRLAGPFELTFDRVDRVLPAGQSGVFALGQVDGTGTFRVQRVGRSDDDLRGCLKGLIGCGNQFKFALTGSVREAFDSECELFHRLRPPCSFIHPARSPGSDWTCHWCSLLHL